jgi:hypothetical protein
MTEPPIDRSENERDRSADATTAAVQPRSRLLVWVIVAVLMGGFFVIDVITTCSWLCGEGIPYWLPAVVFGLCIGQLNLIATWASLAPGNIVLRISWSFLLTMSMWYSLVLGNQDTWGMTSSSEMSRSDAVLLMIILLSSVAILQIPLWIAKKVFRWRLTRQPDDTAASLQEDRQFHLQHLLIAAFLLAVALSPLRQVLPPGQIDSLELDGKMCVLLAVTVLCNLVVTIPCIWWAFASRRKSMLFAFAWPVYCAVLTAVEVGILYATVGSLRPEWQETVVIFYVANLSQCAVVLGTLWILRTIGFRMVRLPCRGKRIDTPPSTEIAATEQA